MGWKREPRADALPAPAAGEIYLEYVQLGHQTRVIAIDAVTGIEVTMVGPSSVSRQELGRLAARKLRRRLAQTFEGS